LFNNGIVQWKSPVNIETHFRKVCGALQVVFMFMVERFRFGQDYSYSATGCTTLIDLSEGIEL
jgi:hypothetical protein